VTTARRDRPGGPRPQRPDPPPTDWRTALRDLRSTVALVWRTSPRQTLLITALSLTQAFLPAASLWVAKLLLDAVAAAISGGLGTPAEAFQQLLTLLAIQVAIGALSSLLSTVQGATRELLGDALQNRISLRILDKAAELELASFENADTYDTLRNACREVGTRPLGVMTQLISLGQALITLGSVSALMARLGPAVVPLILLATLPGVWVTSRFGTAGYRMIRRQAADARVQNYLGSLLTSDASVKEVRLFGFERYLLERWQTYYLKFRAQLVELITRRSGWGLAASLVSAGLVALATLSVLRRAAGGLITVGDFSLFVLGIAQVQGQFSNLLSGFTGIYQNLLYMRNLFEFFELPSRDLDAGEVWVGPIDTIVFDDVAFRYPLTDRDILAGVTFRIERGQALALVGENGAGKTTLVKLLTRLYEPTRGRILLNGLDAARFSARSVQQEMSIIFQDFGQYSMTARENIGLGRIDEIAREDEIHDAGERAGADEIVAALPEGYETMLGRMFLGGQQLSGGQWQRLALARLYFRGGSVLVFDEPTAALDANAEFEVIEALRAQARGRITVIISHRFSTVRMADQIVVLDGGVISEAGSHEELLANGEVYATMFRLQARGYSDEGYGD
jgi:ATP-binding cassette subfamily B protein